MKKTNVKPKSKSIKTISGAFREVLRIGCRNKDTAVECISELLAKTGTSKPKETIKNQINNMLYDIKRQRKGWWEQFKVIDQKDRIQIVLR